MEIAKILMKGVIIPISRETGEFISRPKKDGDHRMILNLKKLMIF